MVKVTKTFLQCVENLGGGTGRQDPVTDWMTRLGFNQPTSVYMYKHWTILVGDFDGLP